MISYKNFVLYILLALIPAIFINQFLFRTIQPRKSGKRLLIYIIILLAVTFAYTLIAGLIVFRFVWPLKQ